eukprot:11109031-Alexandrium_andersonii.AAC.1
MCIRDRRRGANFGDVGAEDVRQRLLDLGRHSRVRCQQPRLCPEVGVLQRPKSGGMSPLKEGSSHNSETCFG